MRSRLRAALAVIAGLAAWRLRRDRSGNTEVEGKAMAGPDSRGTRLTLPSSGDYLLVIGTTRGGADYRLGVAVR